MITALGLLLLTLLVYLPALEHGFVDFDDPLYVTGNPRVQEGLHWDNVRWAFSDFHVLNYHPLTLLSHMLDVELFGLDARGHHLTSVLWHAINAVLLFLVLRSLAATRRDGPSGAEGHDAFWPGVLVAALFAVHPLRVESVAWIAERKDVLSGFFFLLALGLYGAWCRRPTAARYLALLAATALGLLAKPMLVTLPCVLLLLDAWPLGRLPLQSWRAAARALPRLVGEKVPLFALSILFSHLTVLAQTQATVALERAPLGFRLANATTAWATYLAKTLWPRDLAFFYPLPESVPATELALAVALLAALSGMALWLFRRALWLLVGWLWFLGTLVPVIGLFQVGEQALADRYTYIPQIGLLIALAWSAAALVRWRPRLALPVTALALAALLAFSLVARAQVGVWQDNETLFRHAVEVAPSVRAHLNLAETLREEGRPGEAIEHYRAALEIEPRWAEIHAGLSQAFLALRRVTPAIRAARRAAELGPEDPRFRHGLAVALDAGGELDAAIEQLEIAVELDPQMLPAHLGLAELYRRRGDEDRSRSHFERARELTAAPP